MAITWTDVSDLDPPLATVPSQQQDAILAFVAAYLSTSSLGDHYDMASLLLAAHLGALAKRGGGAGGAGPVSSESAGSVSRSYMNIMATQKMLGNLGATIWGQQYRLLTTSLFGGGMVI